MARVAARDPDTVAARDASDDRQEVQHPPEDARPALRDRNRSADKLCDERLEGALDRGRRRLRVGELGVQREVAEAAGEDAAVRELLPVVEAVACVVRQSKSRSAIGSVTSIWPRVGTIDPSSSPSRPLGSRPSRRARLRLELVERLDAVRSTISTPASTAARRAADQARGLESPRRRDGRSPRESVRRRDSVRHSAAKPSSRNASNSARSSSRSSSSAARRRLPVRRSASPASGEPIEAASVRCQYSAARSAPSYSRARSYGIAPPRSAKPRSGRSRPRRPRARRARAHASRARRA